MLLSRKNKTLYIFLLIWNHTEKYGAMYDSADSKLRLRVHGIGYVQIRLGSGPLWYGSTQFTQDRFESGMGRFHMGSL